MPGVRLVRTYDRSWLPTDALAGIGECRRVRGPDDGREGRGASLCWNVTEGDRMPLTIPGSCRACNGWPSRSLRRSRTSRGRWWRCRSSTRSGSARDGALNSGPLTWGDSLLRPGNQHRSRTCTSEFVERTTRDREAFGVLAAGAVDRSYDAEASDQRFDRACILRIPQDVAAQELAAVIAPGLQRPKVVRLRPMWTMRVRAADGSLEPSPVPHRRSPTMADLRPRLIAEWIDGRPEKENGR